MKRIIATVLLLLLVLAGSSLGASERQAPRRFALLIDDQHTSDVRSLQQLLVDDFGFAENAITTLTEANATGAGIRDSILKLSSRVGPNDSIFMLLALRTTYGADGLQMLPADADPGKPWTTIRPDEVIKLLGGESRGNGFVILPYCVAGNASYAQSATRPVYWSFENLSAIAVCPRNTDAPLDMSLSKTVLDSLRSSDANEVRGDQLADLIMRRAENVTAQLLSAKYTSSTVFVRQQNRITVLGNQLHKASSVNERIAIIKQLSDEVAGVSADRRAAWTSSAGAILISQLNEQNSDPNVQLEAARAIARIQYGPGIDAILKAIEASPESLRGELATVVGQFPPEQALPAIELLLVNSSPAVRVGALRSLADIRKEESIPRVQKLLQVEKEQDVVVIALQLLGRVGANDPASLQLIGARLTDLQASVRSEGMATLAMLDPQNARKSILDQLTRDPDPLVGERASYTAGRYYRNDPEMESVLLEILKSDSPDSLRRAAAWALGQMHCIAAENELTRWLLRSNENTLMRTTAAEALGSIGSSKSVLPLIDILKGKNRASVELQIAAAMALGQIGDARAVQPLLEALKSSDYNMRSAALLSIDQIKTSSVQSLDKQIHDPSPVVRAAAIGKIRPTDKKNTLQLIEALGDSDNRVHDAAVKALSQDSCSECRRLMVQQLNTLSSAPAKVGLLRAIQAIHDQQLSIAALSLAKDRDSGVRVEVVQLASQLPSDQGLPVVLNAADDPDVYVRAMAASSLAAFHSPQSDTKLQSLTRDHSAIVRSAAVQSLVSQQK